jgi:hypothetical protein
MKRITHVKILFLVMIIALMVTSAYAAPVTSLPGGTIIPMPNVNYFGSGPQTFGPGNSITWTSTNAVNQGGSVFGWTGGYGFADNGYWDDLLDPMTGLNSAAFAYSVTDTMTFAFSTPVKGVGGFVNYVPDYGTTPTTIAVYDTNMNLIESEDLTFHTDGSTNSGEFHGFLESGPTIKYFTLSDNYIGITKLTIDTDGIPVPEFPSVFLPVTMIIGMLGAMLLIQRTREH